MANGIYETCDITGLYTMMPFMQEATELLHNGGASTENLPISFIYFDVANFKGLNQKRGFQQGNIFLRYVAGLLKEAFKNDLIARFNDDHFVVATQKTDITRLIRKMQDKIYAHEKTLRMEIKAGIYQPPQDVLDIPLIVDRAKMACDSIKRTYDTFYCYFTESMEDELNFHTHIIRSFHQAMREGRIEVYYQPEVRVLTRNICGFEALARWRDEEFGMINPGVFVEVLENAHLSHQLDLYIVNQVCKHIAKVRYINNAKPLSISINLSRSDFRLTDMLKAIDNIRNRYNVDRRLINIEVTESAMTEDEEFLREEIARFRREGYEIWLDDFGSGYSSLNSIKDYVVDVLKIDMSFLRSFESNPKSKIILRAIVNMAKELNIQTLAEGVETEEQFRFLQEIGCEKVQGYLFSKPLPFKNAVKLCYGENAPFSVEAFDLGNYYRQIGTINVLSSSPLENEAPPAVGHSTALAIIEKRESSITYLYRNKSFNSFLHDIGFDHTRESRENYKVRRQKNDLVLYRLMEQAQEKWSEVCNDFITRGILCRMRIRKMFRDDDTDRSVFLVTAMTVSRFSVEAGSAQEATHHILGVYDRVDLLNISNHTSTLVYIAEAEMLHFYEYSSTQELMNSYADNVIVPEERANFKRFYSKEFLQKVFDSRDSRIKLTKVFHKQTPNGRISRLHILIPFHINQQNYIISCMQALTEDNVTFICDKCN